METKISPSKSAMQYGVFFGLIMILELVISYVFNIDATTNKSYGIVINFLNFLILPILFIYFGCVNYRDKINNGYISFGECLKIGVLICVLAALVYGIFGAIFNALVPEFMEEILRKSRVVMMEQNPNMTQEQVDMAISWTEKFMNPLISIPIAILMYAFIGLIYSLIVGAIVKKDSPQNF